MTTRLRLAARLALPLGITGSVLAGTAAPAFAATPSLTVSPGSTVSANTTVSVTATDPGTTALGSRTLTLALTGPDGSALKTWSSPSTAKTQSASVLGKFDSAAPFWSSQSAANGAYTFTADNGSSTSKTVVTVAVPPSDVSGFAGSASGSVATFTWAASTDNVPDFAGYLISAGSSSVKVAPNSGACDTHSCGVSIDYGSAARGNTYSFSIVALRSKAPGSSTTVPSADPATTSVAFPAPPSPAPSSSDGTGSTTGTGGSTSTGGTSDGTAGGGSTNGDGTTGGSGTGTGGGTTSSGGARGPAPTGKNPGADLGHYLPTLSAGAAPNLPSVVTEIKPIPQGTYKPTLAYPDRTLTSTSTKQLPAKGIDAVGDDIVKVLNLRMLWTSLAGAVLLLLVAGHLRAWLDGIDPTD